MVTSKRMSDILKSVPSECGLSEAFDYLKSTSRVRFIETIDVSIRLGIDTRKSDQIVRGSTLLPHGTGKEKKIIVFAEGPEVQNIIGAERVGGADLVEEIRKGFMKFDVVIATPEMMRLVTPLGKILGPKGLMPNPKLGTVTENVAQAVLDSQGKKIFFRNDAAGIIHTMIGKATFDSHLLCENLYALLRDLKNLQPSTSKGMYFKALHVSSTMGCSIKIKLQSLNYN